MAAKPLNGRSAFQQTNIDQMFGANGEVQLFRQVGFLNRTLDLAPRGLVASRSDAEN